jgi:hypothetical protein
VFANHCWKVSSHCSPWRICRLIPLQQLNAGLNVIPVPGRYDNQLAAALDFWN